VSGGLDSSSIFCVARAAATQDARVPAVLGLSYLAPAGTAGDERHYLDDLETRYGAIERLTLSARGFMHSAADQVRVSESPLLDAQGNGTAEFYQCVRDRGARVLLTGHWGDQVLCDRGYLLDLIRSLRWRRVRAHLAEYPAWFTDSEPAQFRSQFRRDLVCDLLPDTVVRRVRAVLARWRPQAPDWYTTRLSGNPGLPEGPWPDGGAGRQARSHYRTLRSSFHTLCLEWNYKMAARFGLNVAFPFLDRDLLTFLITVPGDVQSPRGIPKALLREACADVIPRAIVERRWKADFTTLVNQSVRDDYGGVLRSIDGARSAAGSGYVSAGILESGTAPSGPENRNDCLASCALKDLVGLEFWLREFSNAVGGR